MRVEQVVTYLEMTSLDELRPGQPPPAPVSMYRLPSGSPVVRTTDERIGAPHHWSTNCWSAEQWDEWLARPHLHHWAVRIGDEVAGLLSVEAQSDGNAEITTLGLVPEFVGRGFGGHVLTLATRLAWGLPARDGGSTRRVWLHTSSLDHPHALPNYLSRGFRRFRVESRPRDIPG